MTRSTAAPAVLTDEARVTPHHTAVSDHMDGSCHTPHEGVMRR
jgi:hypothetical protein